MEVVMPPWMVQHQYYQLHPSRLELLLQLQCLPAYLDSLQQRLLLWLLHQYELLLQ
jgi:hypothetical protein